MFNFSNRHSSETSGIKWLLLSRSSIIVLSMILVYLSGGRHDFPFMPYSVFFIFIGLIALNITYYLVTPYVKNYFAAFVMVQMVFDIAAETGLVFFTGGVQSHFVYLYFASIMTGSMLLTRKASAAFACFSTVGMALVTVLHLTDTFTGFISPLYRPYEANVDNYIARMLVITLAFFLVAFLSGLLQSRLLLARILNEEILQNMPEGVVVFDNTDHIVFLNEEFIRLFSDGKVVPAIGMNIEKLFNGKGLEHLKQILVDGKSYRFELEEKKNIERDLPPMEIRVSPVGSQSNKKGVVAIFVDLSQRQRAEQAERKAERFEAVGAMAAGLAHEIRNPLASVRGSIQEISASFEKGSPDYKLCEIVINESDRLDNIITEFLQFARVRPVHITNCNISTIVDDLKVLLEKNPENADVNFILKSSDPKLMVKADPDQLREVFLNIGINACSAMKHKGTLRIEVAKSLMPPVYSSDLTKNKMGVLLSFSDTGPGFKIEMSDKIFDPFYTTKPHGTGLGLSISKKIIESHNGFIWADSKIDEGTVFYCWIPNDGPFVGNGQKRRTTSYLVKKDVN